MDAFYIKRLKVTGENKKNAEVEFRKGLNVIHGPSNTGKSYIFQCIDYAFGAKKIKEIPESRGYSKLYLEIRNLNTDEPITIVRFLDSKDIFYYSCSIDEITDMQVSHKLKSKHDPAKEDNISKFLLKQIGINENKYLVKNKRGEKLTLSFRSIVHLTMISETDIISEEKSPVLETQSVQQPYSKSVFRYLLTNKDDIACGELEKPEIRKAKNEAKIEYIKEEIEVLIEEQIKLNDEKSKHDEDSRYDLDYYKNKIAEIEGNIAKKRQELHNINENNNKLYLRKNKIQITLEKFQLLKKQYLSDQERIEFLADGNSVLSQVPMHRCPLCNGIVAEDIKDEERDEILECCNDEKAKIQVNLNELEVTIGDLNRELENINASLAAGAEQEKKYNEKIELISSQDLKPIKMLFQIFMNRALIDGRLTDIEETINRKRGEIIAFEESKNIKEEAITTDLVVDHHIYSSLCEEIKNDLISCGYSGVDEVVFDIKIQDIEINGVPRLSNGKGYRAFFYAIFSAALMSYLKKKQHPFSQVLILDSPLTTLKESELDDAKEEDFVSSSLQDGFFTFLADEFVDKQAIIIENKQPPKSIVGRFNDIVFKRDKGEGRYGFFEK